MDVIASPIESFGMESDLKDVVETEPEMSLFDKRIQPTMEEMTALEAYPWYHGAVIRTDAMALLKESGDFVVRLDERANEFIVTLLWEGEITHLHLIRDTETWLYHMPTQSFPDVAALVTYYVSDGADPVITQGAVKLRHPIPKSAPTHD